MFIAGPFGHHVILGRRQFPMSGRGTVLPSIHHDLWVFDSHAELKRLGLDPDASLVQHAYRIASGMADRQQGWTGRYPLVVDFKRDEAAIGA